MEYKNMVFKLVISSSYLLFSVILYIPSIQSVTAITFNSNDTDREALLAIKDQVQLDPFQALSSWNDSIHFCNWHGVTCRLRHQRVTVLNISSLKLVGSLSPYVGNLSFLREVNIQNNNFHGPIPPEIDRLFRLQFLRLTNNSFQGKLLTNLTHFSDLQVINLLGNKIEGDIPVELGSLSKLSVLSLARNNFSGKIPPSIGNLSSLTILGLSKNNLHGSIPNELGKLSNLSAFQMSSNKLLGIVPAQVFNISSIQIFSITNNQLSGNFPPNLGLTLPKLNLFLVDLNQFSGSIPASLANASGLVKLSMGDNNLTGLIPLNLGRLQDLQVLHFGHNPLGSNKANDIDFISSLTNCSSLQVLSLSRIQIGGVLPSTIGNLSTTLTSVWLNNNYISGTIPPEIGNLVSLSYLTIDTNLLTGTIPDSIGKLTKMQELYLFTNNISGEIPSSIGNLTQLSILILQENLLEGSIPSSLGNCKGLQGLHLRWNRLTGAIPEQVLGLSSLSIGLMLDHNQLTGSLPSQVGSLKNLATLDISENKLSGEIPSTLGDCVMVETLYMQGNYFEGTIPSSLSQIKSILVIDLSRNNLSGPIPRSLGELNLIKNLNLSFNMLKGEVPNEGVFTNISEFSVLGNEKLCGGIKPLELPACRGKVKQGKLSNRTVVILATAIPIFVVLLLVSVYAIYHIRRSKGQQPSSASAEEKQFPQISYADLLQSTNGFSSENLIGEGRFGTVYKGVLISNEEVVAVKVLKLQEHGANKSFLAECEALRNVRHRNLVKIISACSSLDYKGNDFKALVFDFMSNGSLDTWLHPSSSEEQQDTRNLSLTQRLSIAIDVASALEYLHHHCGTPIIHCDLKPSNILLDNELCAHVGDFGLAKFLLDAKGKSNNANSSSIGIRGTIGYVAPGNYH
ncbi:unnamed protein product [Ilex paraguariensis]|uniref:non-specific serine/threonine protein kinase n=1 Tax=Ilex paraguariensis TaxID=185542 RepID=A0ABC8U073_9AQUA